MALKNPWIGYFDRTYEQIRNATLTLFQSQVPEITDHTETNPWVKGISIWSALMEMLGYYVDNAAREVYITQAKLYSSGVSIARQFDYRIKGPIPASVTLRFTSNVAASGDITIPQFTEVQTSLGVKFLTTETVQILTGQTFVDVIALQQYQVSGVTIGTSDGTADQEFELEAKIADQSISALVDVQPYTGQDTFAYSLATDFHFVAGINENQLMQIRFGDDINGVIPPSGDDIVLDYMITEGASGNIGANLITTINSVITVPGSEVISVNNSTQATGGVDFEDLTKLRKRIPLTIRTKYRAVTEQDFIDLAETQQGVERAGVLFDCGVDNTVGIYIAPEGGGAASQTLIDNVTAFLDDRKIITTSILVQTVGEIFFDLNVTVIVLPGYSNLTVKTAVENALLDFFSVSTQDIGGGVKQGDIYEVVEGVTGVDNSVLNSFIAEPHARPLNNSEPLDWDPDLKAGSASTAKWLIRMLTGGATFELHKNDVFQGTFSVDTLVDLTEVSFTVNGTHTAGNDYEFYTYIYNANVDLLEPSIATTEISRLTVNVSGGV